MVPHVQKERTDPNGTSRSQECTALLYLKEVANQFINNSEHRDYLDSINNCIET